MSASTVDVVLTDTRLWARSEWTHWDGPPSILPASDGASFIVGEQLRPQYPAVSMVRLAGADRIAFAPSLPPVTDAWAVTLGAVLTNLRLPTPCEQLTIVGPSEWGRRRRAAMETAARRLVSRVTVEPLARRAASLGSSTAQQQRIAVLELNPLTTTVSLIGRSGHDTWVEACEHEPAIGLADVEEGHGLRVSSRLSHACWPGRRRPICWPWVFRTVACWRRWERAWSSSVDSRSMSARSRVSS